MTMRKDMPSGNELLINQRQPLKPLKEINVGDNSTYEKGSLVQQTVIN